jgi:hypothetical protein
MQKAKKTLTLAHSSFEKVVSAPSASTRIIPAQVNFSHGILTMVAQLRALHVQNENI